MSSADDRYETQNDRVMDTVPAGDAQDNDFVSRTDRRQAPTPVQSDGADIEDPIGPTTDDSEEQLGMLEFRASVVNVV